MTKSIKAPAWSPVQLTAFATIAGDQPSGLINNEVVKTMLVNPVFAGKTAPMLRGKAKNLELYQSAPVGTRASSNEPVTRKASVVKALEIALSLPVDSLDSLGKGKKDQLELAVARLIEISTLREVEDEENADS